jgi:hypothetical protein
MKTDVRRSRNNNDYSRPLNGDRVPQITKVQNIPPRDYTNSNDLPQDLFPDDYNEIKKREVAY